MTFVDSSLQPLRKSEGNVQFSVVDGELTVGGIPLTRLAARAGSTPFYAYDRQLITSKVSLLRSLLPAEVKLSYALKANPMPALLAHLAPLVSGFDVASAGEMARALDAGMPANDVSFSGPGKRSEELVQALAAGVLLNVESIRELDEIAGLAHKHGYPARVVVRINPDFELKTSGMKMGGGAQPFGIDSEQVPDLLQRMKGGMCQFAGFQIYAGSQNLHSAAICASLRKSFELMVRLRSCAPGPVRIANLGGGFGIPYFPGEQRLALGEIASTIFELTQRASEELPEARLVLELGRFLVGEAGIFVTRIVDKKVSRGRTYLIADGGLNHHLAATGNFGQVIRRNYPVAIGNRMDQPLSEMPVSVVGPLCTPLDVLADQILLPEAKIGDLVVVFQSGAYGASASPIHFLGHPAAPEVLV